VLACPVGGRWLHCTEPFSPVSTTISLFAAACCGCNPAAASTVFFSLWIAAAAIQTAATVSACSQPNTPYTPTLGLGLCFLAACLRSAVAGLQRSQRDSSSAAFADPDGPARARPIFLQSAAAPTPSAHFLLFGPAPPDMPGQKKKNTGSSNSPALLRLCFFPFPVFFFFVTRSKKKMILEIVLASVR
jgi:hypothetical protein